MKKLTSRAYATALIAAWTATPEQDHPAMIRRFLELLRRQRAMKLLPRIIDWVHTLEDTTAGRTRAMVTGAVDIDAAKITKDLTEKLGAVTVTTATDPALIGGLAIRVGDTVVDGTVATRLKKLAQLLHHPSYVPLEVHSS